jgi:hypothetical protein
MKKLKLFLRNAQRTKSMFPKEKYEMLMEDIDSEIIGISGWGTFTINYSIIFNVIYVADSV